MSSEQLYFSEGQLFPIFGGGSIPDPLVINNLDVNVAASINNLTLDNIPNASTANGLYYNTTTKQVSYATATTPDPLVINNLDVNVSASINNLTLDNIPSAVTSNTLYYDTTSKQVSFGTPSISENGFGYTNTTNTTILSIPLTLTIVPISFAASPTITYSITGTGFSIPTPSNNRIVYTGTTKKFNIYTDLSLSVAGSSGSVYFCWYRNGSAIANAMAAQTVAIAGAINPSIELVHFMQEVTLNNNDYLELYTYGNTTGVSINPITPSPSLFVPATFQPSINILCEQVNF